ncbi:MAG: hypothetical protein ACXU82_03700 [Caulobacteraceae bacterium]
MAEPLNAEWLKGEDALEILGLMNFQTCPVAHLFRATGEDIPHKTELEQAFVLGWLLGLALEHGADWRDHADTEIARRRALLPKKASA